MRQRPDHRYQPDDSRTITRPRAYVNLLAVKPTPASATTSTVVTQRVVVRAAFVCLRGRLQWPRWRKSTRTRKPRWPAVPGDSLRSPPAEPCRGLTSYSSGGAVRSPSSRSGIFFRQERCAVLARPSSAAATDGNLARGSEMFSRLHHRFHHDANDACHNSKIPPRTIKLPHRSGRCRPPGDTLRRRARVSTVKTDSTLKSPRRILIASLGISVSFVTTCCIANVRRTGIRLP